MMIKRWMVGLFVLAATVATVPALAADYAFIRAPVNLRAGPRVGYPVLVVLSSGTQVLVHGCVQDYAWCDVSVDGERGWVSAAYLDYEYEGRPVIVEDYGPQLGIAIITFSIVEYWGDYYRHRPWYSRRAQYRDRFGAHAHIGLPPPRHAPPRPPRPPSVPYHQGAPGYGYSPPARRHEATPHRPYADAPRPGHTQTPHGATGARRPEPDRTTHGHTPPASTHPGPSGPYDRHGQPQGAPNHEQRRDNDRP